MIFREKTQKCSGTPSSWHDAFLTFTAIDSHSSVWKTCVAPSTAFQDSNPSRNAKRSAQELCVMYLRIFLLQSHTDCRSFCPPTYLANSWMWPPVGNESAWVTGAALIFNRNFAWSCQLEETVFLSTAALWNQPTFRWAQVTHKHSN